MDSFRRVNPQWMKRILRHWMLLWWHERQALLEVRVPEEQKNCWKLIRHSHTSCNNYLPIPANKVWFDRCPLTAHCVPIVPKCHPCVYTALVDMNELICGIMSEHMVLEGSTSCFIAFNCRFRELDEKLVFTRWSYLLEWHTFFLVYPPLLIALQIVESDTLRVVDLQKSFLYVFKKVIGAMLNKTRYVL